MARLLKRMPVGAKERLSKWLAFRVLVALLAPLVLKEVLVYVVLGNWMYPADLVAHGELFLIGAAISAGAVGDVVDWGRSVPTYLIGGFTVLVLIAASFGFGVVSILSGPNKTPSPAEIDRILNMSVGTLFFATINGAVCRAFSEN